MLHRRRRFIGRRCQINSASLNDSIHAVALVEGMAVVAVVVPEEVIYRQRAASQESAGRQEQLPRQTFLPEFLRPRPRSLRTPLPRPDELGTVVD